MGRVFCSSPCPQSLLIHTHTTSTLTHNLNTHTLNTHTLNIHTHTLNTHTHTHTIHTYTHTHTTRHTHTHKHIHTHTQRLRYLLTEPPSHSGVFSGREKGLSPWRLVSFLWRSLDLHGCQRSCPQIGRAHV